mmetsp:Transcript_24329/g.47297  ORF Transcript_24329/g.47297 Transcript_24329/m.47297 type:complete len:215 (-) Transcript_24329:1467-2111(-)
MLCHTAAYTERLESMRCISRRSGCSENTSGNILWPTLILMGLGPADAGRETLDTTTACAEAWCAMGCAMFRETVQSMQVEPQGLISASERPASLHMSTCITFKLPLEASNSSEHVEPRSAEAGTCKLTCTLEGTGMMTSKSEGPTKPTIALGTLSDEDCKSLIKEICRWTNPANLSASIRMFVLSTACWSCAREGFNQDSCPNGLHPFCHFKAF